MGKLIFENVYVPVDDEKFERLLTIREEIFARGVVELLKKENGEGDPQCQKSIPSPPPKTAPSS